MEVTVETETEQIEIEAEVKEAEVEVKADESSIFAILPPEYHDGKLGLKDTFRDKEWGGHTLTRDWYGELQDELDVSTIETTI